MAILVIQLARFGDIFQTWPTLKALRRKHPGAALHLLVRERFVGATDGLADLGVTVHVLPTANILSSLTAKSTGDVTRDEAAALNEIENFLEPLRALKISTLINLSFSPFSSFLTDELAADRDGVEICGYTRQTDGYLRIPDDFSAYFYAQVGVDKHNRYHLFEIFAAVAQVELLPDDYSHPQNSLSKNRSVVVHLGASQANKTYPGELWIKFLSDLTERIDGAVILVGSASERSLSEAIVKRVKSEAVINRVGQSTLSDLCRWISETRLLVGADSAPVQIASLTGTRVLNLSCAAVNFWETGPRTEGSRILYAEEMHMISPLRISDEVMAMLSNQSSTGPVIERVADKFVPRLSESPSEDVRDFHWNLIQALYTASDYPKLPLQFSPLAFHRLFDLAELAVRQLDEWTREGATPASTAILQSVDELLIQIPKMDPNVAPIVDWFQTQRVRLGPAAPQDTLKATRSLFEQLMWIAAVYHKSADGHRMLERARDLTRECVPKLREYDFASIQDAFQELMSIAQVASTKVGIPAWSSVLNSLQNALERRDFIEAADILESEWTDLLQSASGELSWESGSDTPDRTTPDSSPSA